jgi:hypothetical protein
MPGKIVKMEDGMARALDAMARNQMKSFPELADEAFAALLNKHGRWIGCAASKCTRLAPPSAP